VLARVQWVHKSLGQHLTFAPADFEAFSTFESTLVYRIDVQYEINVQVEKFLKNIKRAGQNRRAGWKFFLKNIKRAGRNRRAGGNFLENPTWFVHLHGFYTYMVCIPT
jgi:hypothetical protein